MTRKLGYLVVEGPHDVEFACKIIKHRSLKKINRIQQISALDPTFKALVPDKFPHGGDLLKRVPVPIFLQNEEFGIAIHSAGGDTKIADCLKDTVDLIGLDKFTSLGVILDSDSEEPPNIRHKKLLDLLESLKDIFPKQPGFILEAALKTGVYVFPDNKSQGTLEDLLIEAGYFSYEKQLESAKSFVRKIKKDCCPTEYKDLYLPAGENKSVIGAVVSLLRPGKTTQVSIQDNNWINPRNINDGRLKEFSDFLQHLFLTAPEPAVVAQSATAPSKGAGA